jgi:hypothetical protein
MNINAVVAQTTRHGVTSQKTRRDVRTSDLSKEPVDLQTSDSGPARRPDVL